MRMGGETGSSAGRLAVRPSPDDVPCSRRFTHGARYSLRPPGVLAPGGQPGGPLATAGTAASGGSAAEQGAPVLGDRDAEDLARAQRDPLVRLRGQVQPVGRPGARDRAGTASTTGRPGSSRARRRCDRRCMLYAAIRPRSSRITGKPTGSKPVNISTRRPGGAQPGDGAVEAARPACPGRPRAEDVVAAAGDGDQAGRHRDGGGHLLGHDLAQQLAADRQVRVLEPRVLDGEQPGQPVGPAAVPAAGRGIVEALGEAVANRHKGRFSRGLRE